VKGYSHFFSNVDITTEVNFGKDTLFSIQNSIL